MAEETSAPARRFAPNSAKAAAHGATGETPAPSYVFLRVKRKRHEDPVECLLVQSEPELKRQQRDAPSGDAAAGDAPAATAESDEAAPAKPANAQRDLLAAFTKLSTRERGFVFTRIDTLEPHQLGDASDAKWAERLKKKAKQQRVNAKKAAVDKAAQLTTPSRAQQQQARLKERRHSDALRTRGLAEAAAAAAAPREMREQQTLELSGVRMVDLTTVSSPSDAAASGATTASSGLTVNGATLGVKRVLNPYERQVDEAVWKAFQHNDFSDFFRIFHSHRPELRVDPAAFQRPADGGTILMAAALHGRADVIEAVLRSSAANVLQQDWNGATASAFARERGHKSVETALLACEEAEREKEFVYDVYCIDTAASEQHSSGARAMGGTGAVGSDLSSAPVVSVSSAVQRWLTQEAGQQAASDDDDVDEFMLESDHENDLDSDGESIDSNHENYAFNDYPDEDSSDYDSDDSDQNLRHRAAGTGKTRAVDERVVADEVDDY